MDEVKRRKQPGLAVRIGIAVLAAAGLAAAAASIAGRWNPLGWRRDSPVKQRGPERYCPGLVGCVCPTAVGEDTRFAVYVPRGYDGNRAYPLLVFLHGYGERGTDGVQHLHVGLLSVIKEAVKRGEEFPFLVLFPHSPNGTWVPGSDDDELVREEMEYVKDRYRVDGRRVVLTGLSNGGTGAWRLGAAHPGWWSAVVPVCGVPDAGTAAGLKGVPVWCFHGGADDGVEAVRAAVKDLKSEGSQVRYVEYEGQGHEIWNEAYRTDGLVKWMLVQSNLQ